MRLIDADALKNEMVTDLANMMRMQEMHKGDMAVRVLNKIDEAPTIEAEPVRHGRWVRHDETQIMFDVDWKCSECDTQITTSGIFKPAAIGWNLCPGCGAKMDKKEENT